MRMPSLDQICQLVEAVEALGDLHVQLSLPRPFGAPEPTWDLNVLYVDIALWQNEIVARVTRFYTIPEQQAHTLQGDPVIMPAGETFRWHLALPPWDLDHEVSFSYFQLPTLAQAVALQRLPAVAFPRPGEVVSIGGCTGPVEWIDLAIHVHDPVVGSVAFPVWTAMFELGRLPEGAER